jgi:hypothetical protein
MLTFNQILQRIKTTSLSHKQIRNYYYGKPTDFLTEKTTQYTSVFLQDNDGSVSISQKTQTVNFKLFVLDLVHVSEDTLQNLQDVQSDCLEIAKDIIALLDDDAFSDWALLSENNFQFLFEAFDDLVGGVVVDIAIKTPYVSDRCAVPLN